MAICVDDTNVLFGDDPFQVMILECFHRQWSNVAVVVHYQPLQGCSWFSTVPIRKLIRLFRCPSWTLFGL